MSYTIEQKRRIYKEWGITSPTFDEWAKVWPTKSSCCGSCCGGSIARQDSWRDELRYQNKRDSHG